MPEPSGEYEPNKLDDHRWIQYGPLKIYFPSPEEARVNSSKRYPCRSLVSNREANLAPSEMAFIMAFDQDIPKTQKQIIVDHKRWLDGAYRDFDISRQAKELSSSGFDVLIHKIEGKLGYGLIEHCNGFRWKMADYPKRK